MKDIFSFILILLLTSKALAAESSLDSGIKAYSQGAYAQALESFQALASGAEVEYWKAQCLFQMQRFTEATPLFEKAIALGAQKEFPEIYYSLGQSAYAEQSFLKSRSAFEKSVQVNVKPFESAYYVAYNSLLLRDQDLALTSFRNLAENKDPANLMRVPAQFQVGEFWFAKAKASPLESEQLELFEKKAKPVYLEALSTDPAHALAVQINARLNELRGKVSNIAPKTRAGLYVPTKVWSANASLDLKYDTNVIQQAEEKTTKITNEDSFYAKFGAFGKYEKMFWDWLIMTPELSGDRSYYFNRDVVSVRANDSININPALRNRLDHKAWSRAASGLVEYEHAWTLKDVFSNGQQIFSTRTHNFVLGERAEPFPSLGSSSIKFNFKMAQNRDRTQNYLGYGATLNQGVKTFGGKYMLNLSFTYERQRSKSITYDQYSYKWIASYIMPNLFWDMSADLGCTFILLNVFNQKEARGLEKNLNPTVGLNRDFGPGKMFNVGLNYAYTLNNSKDKANYKYRKHVYGLALKANF